MVVGEAAGIRALLGALLGRAAVHVIGAGVEAALVFFAVMGGEVPAIEEIAQLVAGVFTGIARHLFHFNAGLLGIHMRCFHSVFKVLVFLRVEGLFVVAGGGVVIQIPFGIRQFAANLAGIE